jgi:hypothetical protein
MEVALLMTKRLLLSVLTVGAVGAALSLAAYAYFFAGSSTAVTVNASSGLMFTYDIDTNCDSVQEATGLSALPPTTTAGPLFPGDTNASCVTLHNDNTTDVDVYVHNDTPAESTAGFLAALGAQVENLSDGSPNCSYAAPDSAQYTTANSNRGCYLGNISAGGSKVYRATVKFVDDNTDQSALASATATWNTNLGGYTTP